MKPNGFIPFYLSLRHRTITNATLFMFFDLTGVTPMDHKEALKPPSHSNTESPFPSSISPVVFVCTGVLATIASSNFLELENSAVTSALCFLSGLRLFHMSRTDQAMRDGTATFYVSLFRPVTCLIAIAALISLMLLTHQFPIPAPLPAWLFGTAIGYLIITFTTDRKAEKTSNPKILVAKYEIRREQDDKTYQYHSMLIFALMLPLSFTPASNVIDSALGYFAGLILFVARNDTVKYYKFLPVKTDTELNFRVGNAAAAMVASHAFAIIQVLISNAEGSNPPLILFVLAGGSITFFKYNARLRETHRQHKIAHNANARDTIN